jgi:hypothetical protein
MVAIEAGKTINCRHGTVKANTIMEVHSLPFSTGGREARITQVALFTGLEKRIVHRGRKQSRFDSGIKGSSSIRFFQAC